jgi:hypothetical protein
VFSYRNAVWHYRPDGTIKSTYANLSLAVLLHYLIAFCTIEINSKSTLISSLFVRASASAALALDTKCIACTLSIECGTTAGARLDTLAPVTEPDGPCNQPAPIK